MLRRTKRDAVWVLVLVAALAGCGEALSWPAMELAKLPEPAGPRAYDGDEPARVNGGVSAGAPAGAVRPRRLASDADDAGARRRGCAVPGGVPGRAAPVAV